MNKKGFSVFSGFIIVLTVGFVVSIFTAGVTHAAQARQTLTNEKIAQLKDPGRQKILEEGAKKEGKLVWYTTLIVDGAVRPMVAAFQKKYPFIKVDYYRADSGVLFQKAKAEFDANRHLADILDGTTPIPPARDAGMLRPFYSPELKNIQELYIDPEHYWVAQNVYYMVLAYNTEMVPAAQAPKTDEDLLNPRWKGKMAWSTSSGSGGPQVIGGFLKLYGEEKGLQYLKKLAAQDVANIQGSGRNVLDKVIAGEYAIGLNMFHDHILPSVEQGAPVKGVPLRPAVNSIAQVMALLKNAPNPCAAMLFIDFFCSDEGQSVMKTAHYTPPSKNIKPEKSDLVPEYGNFKIQFLDTYYIGKNSSKWQTIFKDLFLK